MSYRPYACACPLCSGLTGDRAGGGRDLGTPPAEPIHVNKFTNDYRVDTLLEGLSFRWNASSALGTPVEVTYSFMTAKPTYGGTDSGTDIGFRAFTPQQQEAVRDILARMEREVGIKFVQVSDSDTRYGQIRFGNNTQATSAGYAYMPNSTGDDKSGDIWISDSTPSDLTSVARGTGAYATLVHEIGHAVGLKHPGNYNAGEAAVPASQAGNLLGALEDNTAYTIMSYRDPAGMTGIQRDWFGTYDLLALRALYGPGMGAELGNTTYSFDDDAGARMATLVDGSGTDTLNASAATGSVRVDLRPGAFSSIGRHSGGNATNNVSIDFASTIENFVGGSANDTVIGNSVANRFTLGGGTNSADGGAGIDTATYSGNASTYAIARTSGGLTVTASGTSDTLANVERLQFADRKLAFDDNALITAKVLGAVFGREAVANTSYAGIGLSMLDGGTTYQSLMDLALGVRLGANATHQAVVDLLFTNVIGRAPSAAEASPFVDMLAGGQSRAALGVMAADTTFNTTAIDLVGITANGLGFA